MISPSTAISAKVVGHTTYASGSAAYGERVWLSVAERHTGLTSALRAGTAATAAVLVAAATTHPQQAAFPTSPLMVMSGVFLQAGGCLLRLSFNFDTRRGYPPKPKAK